MNGFPVLNIITKNSVLNANYNSSPQQVWVKYGFFIQAVWTGTPTGTFKLQISGDPQSNVPGAAPTNWSDYSGSSEAISAAGNFYWNVGEVFFNWVRLVYTDGSGGTSTAVLTASTFNAKGV